MSRVVLPAQPLVEGPTALRSWRDTDVPSLVQACQDPEIARWTRVPAGYGETHARLFLLQRYDAVRDGTAAPYAIVESDGSEAALLGSIALTRLHWDQRRGEIGYWLASWARGQGHATRAVRLIAGWAFASLGLERLELMVATGNLASRRVAERAGLTHEATLRAYLRGPDGRAQDMILFGLLPGEL